MLIDEATVHAIQTAYSKGGYRAAVAELRQHFPGLAGNPAAFDCVHFVLAMRSGQANEIEARVEAAQRGGREVSFGWERRVSRACRPVP
jgi:hypothetical protein